MMPASTSSSKSEKYFQESSNDCSSSTLPGIAFFVSSSNCSITQFYIHYFKKCGFPLKYIWAEDLSFAEKLAHSFCVALGSDREDAILVDKNVQLVLVACFPYERVANKALAIGKHVVIAFFSHGLNSSRLLLSASHYYPSLISIIANPLRFLPGMQKLRASIREDLIGCVLASEIGVTVSLPFIRSAVMSSLCEEDLGYGLCQVVGSHVIDTIFFLFSGIRVNKVNAFFHYPTGVQREGSVSCEAAYITFQLLCTLPTNSTILFTIKINSLMPVPNFESSISIHGDKGSLHLQDLSSLFHTNAVKQETKPLFQQNDASFNFKENDLLSENAFPIPLPYVDAVSRVVESLKESFMRCSKGWAKQPISNATNFSDALALQSVIYAIKKSVQSTSWVEVRDFPTSQSQEDEFRLSMQCINQIHAIKLPKH